MKKELLLISANQYKVPYPVYPIGILYLQTFLEKYLPSFRIRNFDCNLDTLESLECLLKENEFHYVGISLRNADDVNFYHKDSFTPYYKLLIDLVRKASKAVTIIGGSGYSIYPLEFYEFLSPDYGVQGEGELALLRLITCLEESGTLDQVDGLVYRKDGKVSINPRNSFIDELELSLDDRLVDYYWAKSGMLNIQTKRGCPFNCIYCTYPLIEGSKVRTLEASKVVDSLEKFSKEKGINYFFFTDSVFNIDKNYNSELAHLIIKRKLDIRWGAYFTPYKLDYESMKLYKEAGLTHVEFGTDSFSNTQLANMRKHFSFEDVRKASQICQDLDIYYAHFLIMGGMGETEATLDETFENSKYIDNSVFFPFIGMRIYPNTGLYKIALTEGKIEPGSGFMKPIYYISDQVNLEKLKDKAMKTGKRWVFPDEDSSELLERMRARNKKGPLWEYLTY